MVIEAKRSLQKRGQAPQKPSPISNIQKIGSLKRYPDQEYANSLLHDVVKLVAPIIHENNFKVGTLCEMFPKNPNLLGLNLNRGQKILIRLRYHSNERSFYPMGDIIGTFLHELTHNIYGPHDSKFYKFLDKLQERFDQIQIGGISSSYFCEEHRLGSSFNANGLVSVREKRMKALGKGMFKAEVRRLGSTSNYGVKSLKHRDIRNAALAAAERRLKDSKWCSSKTDISSVDPSDNEVEIIDVNVEDSNIPICKDENKMTTYKEVVDLTNEDYPDMSINCDEIIVIDGCEKEEPTSPEKVVRAPSKKNVRFIGLSSSLEDDTCFSHSKDVGDSDENGKEEEVHYRSSLSPGRSFIQNEDLYPRRKLVADLNFNQILRKGSTISINEINEIKTSTAIQESYSEDKERGDKSLPTEKQRQNRKASASEKGAPKLKRKPKSKSKKRKMKTNKDNLVASKEIMKPKKHVKSINFEDLL